MPVFHARAWEESVGRPWGEPRNSDIEKSEPVCKNVSEAQLAKWSDRHEMANLQGCALLKQKRDVKPSLLQNTKPRHGGSTC